MTLEQIFLDHLPLIEEVVRFVTRRHRLGSDETEELLGSVKLKMVDNDYLVLRRFRGGNSLNTYLFARNPTPFSRPADRSMGRVAAVGLRPPVRSRRHPPRSVDHP